MKCYRDGLFTSSVNATNTDSIIVFNTKVALSFSGTSST